MDTLSTSEALTLARRLVHEDWTAVAREVLATLLHHDDPAVRRYVRDHRARVLCDLMSAYQPHPETFEHLVHIAASWEALAWLPLSVAVHLKSPDFRTRPADAAAWIATDRDDRVRFGATAPGSPTTPMQIAWSVDGETLHAERITGDWLEPTQRRFVEWLTAVEEM